MCRSCNHPIVLRRIEGLLSRLRDGYRDGRRKIKPCRKSSIVARVAGILKWVQLNEHVTAQQMTALKNIHDAHRRVYQPPRKRGHQRALGHRKDRNAHPCTEEN